MTLQQIAAEIDDHIRKCGGGYAGWYVGIASVPRDRLFADHSVSEKNGAWIFRDAGFRQGASAIEDHFLKLGCQGGPGGGDQGTRFVYAYRVTSYTVEQC